MHTTCWAKCGVAHAYALWDAFYTQKAMLLRTRRPLARGGQLLKPALMVEMRVAAYSRRKDGLITSEF